MTYRNILGSVPTMQKLYAQDLPIKTAYQLHKMIRRINEEIDFFRSKEQEIRAKHENPNSPAILAELNELLDLTIEWEFEPLPLGPDASIKLSCADLDALEGFITIPNQEDE